MSAMFEKLDVPLEDFVRGLQPIDGQVGAVFLIDGAPVGLELFDAPSTWSKLSPKVIRSYAMDALDRRAGAAPRAAGGDASALLAAVTSASASVFPATGEGEDIRLESARVAGAALVAHGRAIHVSAFPNHAE